MNAWYTFLSNFKIGDNTLAPMHRSDSLESTQSEREFKKKYQAITHRMVHRKSSAVMYSKILERTFGKSRLQKHHINVTFAVYN